MTFQYFFFDTDVGYFLQALPIALLCGGIFLGIRRKRLPEEPWGSAAFSALFVCYLAGLLCLTLFLDAMGIGYHWLFYHFDSGRSIPWFQGCFDFELTLGSGLSRENIGNLLMLLPFGVLYPLFDRKAGWKRTIAAGIFTIIAVEVLQPIVGRSFDSNDIVLNSFGVFLSATAFFGIKTIYRKIFKKV